MTHLQILAQIPEAEEPPCLGRGFRTLNPAGSAPAVVPGRGGRLGPRATSGAEPAVQPAAGVQMRPAGSFAPWRQRQTWPSGSSTVPYGSWRRPGLPQKTLCGFPAAPPPHWLNTWTLENSTVGNRENASLELGTWFPRPAAGPPQSVSLMVSKQVGLLRRIGGQRHLGANVQSCRFTKRRVQVIFILLIK